jgi:hypothetical protein
MLHLGITVYLGKGILTFHREIGRADLGADYGEVGALFGEEFVEHTLALLFGQAGEYEGRRLGE